MRRVKLACIKCKEAHAGRPCGRCKSLGLEDCRDPDPKKRGRKPRAVHLSSAPVRFTSAPARPIHKSSPAPFSAAGVAMGLGHQGPWGSIEAGGSLAPPPPPPPPNLPPGGGSMAAAAAAAAGLHQLWARHYGLPHLPPSPAAPSSPTFHLPTQHRHRSEQEQTRGATEDVSPGRITKAQPSHPQGGLHTPLATPNFPLPSSSSSPPPPAYSTSSLPQTIPPSPSGGFSFPALHHGSASGPPGGQGSMGILLPLPLLGPSTFFPSASPPPSPSSSSTSSLTRVPPSPPRASLPSSFSSSYTSPFSSSGAPPILHRVPHATNRGGEGREQQQQWMSGDNRFDGSTATRQTRIKQEMVHEEAPRIVGTSHPTKDLQSDDGRQRSHRAIAGIDENEEEDEDEETDERDDYNNRDGERGEMEAEKREQEDRRRRLCDEEDEGESRDETKRGGLLRSIMGELQAIKRSNTELKDDQRLMQAELLRLRHENALLRQTSHLSSAHDPSSPSSSSSSSSPPLSTLAASASSSAPSPRSGWVHTPVSGTSIAADPADPAPPRPPSAENMDSTSLPFVIKDALKPFAILKKVGNDGFFILANHAFCTLYRYTLAELVGQSWRILIPPKEHIAIWTNFSPLLHDTDNPARVSDVLSMQAHHRTKEGIEFETVTHHQMFYDECGKPYWDVIYIDSYRFPSHPPAGDPSAATEPLPPP